MTFKEKVKEMILDFVQKNKMNHDFYNKMHVLRKMFIFPYSVWGSRTRGPNTFVLDDLIVFEKLNIKIQILKSDNDLRELFDRNGPRYGECFYINCELTIVVEKIVKDEKAIVFYIGKNKVNVVRLEDYLKLKEENERLKKEDGMIRTLSKENMKIKAELNYLLFRDDIEKIVKEDKMEENRKLKEKNDYLEKCNDNLIKEYENLAMEKLKCNCDCKLFRFSPKSREQSTVIVLARNKEEAIVKAEEIICHTLHSGAIKMHNISGWATEHYDCSVAPAFISIGDDINPIGNIRDLKFDIYKWISLLVYKLIEGKIRHPRFMLDMTYFDGKTIIEKLFDTGKVLEKDIDFLLKKDKQFIMTDNQHGYHIGD
jgi:hypothetical protein